MKYTIATALIVGDYRWTLFRGWEASFDPLIFVMLNPSRADAEVDDPTLRRCVGFAEREGRNAIGIVNLLPYRTRSPKKLDAWYGEFFGRDPMGFRDEIARNYGMVKVTAIDRDVVLAWGANGLHYQLETTEIERIVRENARNVYTLGDRTKHGQPRHPLYLSGDTPLVKVPR